MLAEINKYSDIDTNKKLRNDREQKRFLSNYLDIIYSRIINFISFKYHCICTQVFFHSNRLHPINIALIHINSSKTIFRYNPTLELNFHT